MKKINKKLLKDCRIFRQVSAVRLVLSLVLSFTFSFSLIAQELSLAALNPYSKIQNRVPSNFVPNDDIEPSPFFENKLWIEKAFVADNEGVLTKMRGQIQNWQDTEEYAKNWHVQSTGLYNTPEKEDRTKMLKSGFLKYADKRLAGEMKDAEEGSAMASVTKAQKALRPSADVGVGSNVKVKFRAKAIQGESKVVVENPWFDYETKYRVFANNLSTSAGKNFKTIGFKASTDYQVSEKNWATNFEQKITDPLSVRVTSNQSNKEMAFGSRSDRIVQLLYSQGW